MTTFTAYRVIAGGTHIQPLEHVRSTRNGWHTYRVLPPDPMACEVFNVDGLVEPEGVKS